MKRVPSLVFCAILLSCPAIRSLPVLSANDVKFLESCGVKQDDIKVIPNLPRDGQLWVWGILRADDRTCSDLKAFKGSRDFLREFTPPPSEVPVPPAEYDPNFLTKDEIDFINKVNKGILDKAFGANAH